MGKYTSHLGNTARWDHGDLKMNALILGAFLHYNKGPAE